jgi:hypothetical protein
VAQRKRGSARAPTYDTSIALGDDGGRALETSMLVLAAAGFRLAGKTASSAELTAPPSAGSLRNPLLGASRLRLSMQEGRLSVAAELGGAAYLSRLVHVLPLGLMAVLGLSLGIVFSLAFDGEQAADARTATLAALLGQVVVWAVVGPLLARRFEARTRKALDTFVANVRLIAARD